VPAKAVTADLLAEFLNSAPVSKPQEAAGKTAR
jgi:hypothetical protein